jgi:hypothetical protein
MKHYIITLILIAYTWSICAMDQKNSTAQTNVELTQRLAELHKSESYLLDMMNRKSHLFDSILPFLVGATVYSCLKHYSPVAELAAFVAIISVFYACTYRARSYNKLHTACTQLAQGTNHKIPRNIAPENLTQLYDEDIID